VTAAKLIRAGDVELNPGPPVFSKHKNHDRNITPMTTTSSTNETNLKIYQININGIQNKIEELRNITQKFSPDIIAVQETKLTPNSNKFNIPGYTTIRRDRDDKSGGGLTTYIKDNIPFTEITQDQNTKSDKIEYIVTKINLNKKKQIHVTNIYIPPRDSNANQTNENLDIENHFKYWFSFQNNILCGDFNAHAKMWHSTKNDPRGNTISNLILDSNHITLNTNTPTRIPFDESQKETSPDITIIPNEMIDNSSWKTDISLKSDHVPIIITINLKTKFKFKLTQNRRSYTNYRKANWTNFTEEIEKSLENIPKPNDVNTANNILTNLILNADKHNIPKGKIKAHNILQPKEIRDKIDERNKLRKINYKDPKIIDLNSEITKMIQDNKAKLWKEKIEQCGDHKINTHKLWNTINQLQNKKTKTEINRNITFKKKEACKSKEKAEAFNKQFVNVTKYTTNKINRKIDKNIKNLPNTEDIKFTSIQVFEAIKKSKNNNSIGPDNINIKHLKHLGPLAIDYLKEIYNLSVSKNIIPHIWKLAKIVPILKPQKDPNDGNSYRPISLLSPIVKTLEKLILPSLTSNIPDLDFQHGFKTNYSTTTALHKINHTIAEGFNKKQGKIKPERTIMVSLDMSKAFDTVNIHTLLQKILNTKIPNKIIKFLSNYLKGREAYTIFQDAKSRKRKLKTGVPQGGVLSPCLFNIYMSDIPRPPDNVQLEVYADDMNTLSSNSNYKTAEANLQPYLDKIFEWTKENDLQLNASKSTATLFTTDPSEFQSENNKIELSLTIGNNKIPTVKHPKVLGITFDPKLNYGEHINKTKEKASKTVNIIKALTSTKWGKQKETLVNTYKTITRPIIEYGCTIWAPIITKTKAKKKTKKKTKTKTKIKSGISGKLNKIQIVQNSALRIATGCTKDTEIQHIHEETKVLPLKEHLKLHSSQLRQKSKNPNHPLFSLHKTNPKSRHIRETIFDNKNFTLNLNNKTKNINDKTEEINKKLIHSKIVKKYLTQKEPNTVIKDIAPEIDKYEETLPRETRRILAQLRANKSPILFSYRHKIDKTNSYPSPLCPLCKTHIHDTNHLFNCTKIFSSKTSISLWNDPAYVSSLLMRWRGMGGLA
jgi:endonuclease/exonuclease/phosphatase family metal-dependent hydrolase